MKFARMLSFFFSFDQVVDPRAAMLMISTLIADLIASAMVAFIVTLHVDILR